MIPKTIHYCWFGGSPLPDLAVKCIESWRRYCPDYEIVEWNEESFNVDSLPYTAEAYARKKYAFVTDVVRLYALVNHGGVYMDTDVEVVKPLDALLSYDAVSGFETETEIPTGLMASVKDQPVMRMLLDEYNELHFVKPDGSTDETTNVIRITKSLTELGFVPDNQLQTVCGFTLLPKDYLCPKDYRTGEVVLTDRTLTIHHFNGSWMSEEDQYAKSLRLKAPKALPAKLRTAGSHCLAVLKFRGLFGFVSFLRQKIGNGNEHSE